jgi:hypothetical protein
VSRFPPSIDGWESVATFILNTVWGELKYPNAAPFELIEGWEMVCRQHGVLLRDRYGISSEDGDWRSHERIVGTIDLIKIFYDEEL